MADLPDPTGATGTADAAAWRALIAEATAGAPPPPDFADLLARAATDPAGPTAADLSWPTPSPAPEARSARSPVLRVLAVAAVVALIVAGAVVWSGRGRGNGVASVGASDRLAFNCLEWVNRPADNGGQAMVIVEHTCLAGTDGSGLVRLPGEVVPIYGPVPSPDGRLLATAPIGTSVYRIIRADGTEVATVGGAAIDRPVWTPDGTALVFGRTDGKLVVAPAGGGEPRVYDLGDNTRASLAQLSPDGARIAVRVSRLDQNRADFGAAGPVAVVHRETGLVTWLPGPDDISGLAWSPDGARLALTSLAGGLLALDTGPRGAPPVPLATPQGPADRPAVANVAWSPDGRTIAYGDYASLRLFDVATGRAVSADLGGRTVGGLTADAWSKDGTLIALNALDDDPAASLAGNVPRSDLVLVDRATGRARVVTGAYPIPGYVGAAFPAWLPPS